jgi:hypothetical protein
MKKFVSLHRQMVVLFLFKSLRKKGEAIMAYDKSKDVCIFERSIGDDGKELKVSVFSYNGGEMKLQIGPRTYVKRNGSVGFNKVGRLTFDEVLAINELIPEIRGIMGESLSAVVNG